MMRRVLAWAEDRTGLVSFTAGFFAERIPASCGWKQVLGSVALFALLLQSFSGVLLALNFAPVPGDAYQSLRHIVTEVAGGRLVRAMHHWGASLMVIVVVLHMLQVFVWGAYRRPREATWIVGGLLLLLTMGFSLTGYLLPWDNRAYWGAMVTTRMAADAPLLGPSLTRLLGTENGSIGVVTFSRFYTLHVLLLPALTMALVGVHLVLVRRHGVAPLPGEAQHAKPFYPGQVYKDTVAIFGLFVIWVLLAALVEVPLGRLAEPTDTTYVPRPEWYFLFLFQLLKLLPGPLEVVGTCVLPGLAVAALFLVPLLDRRLWGEAARRTAAVGLVGLAAATWGALTWAAVRGTPQPNEFVQEIERGPQPWQELPPADLAAIGYIRERQCGQCHGPGGTAPDYLAAPLRLPAAWLKQHLQTGGLTAVQRTTVAQYLAQLDDRRVAAQRTAPEFVVRGAALYEREHCEVCHQINGDGGDDGPVLNGLAYRRTRDWVERHFAEPAALSPGTSMPAYRFAPAERQAITRYLLLLPK